MSDIQTRYIDTDTAAEQYAKQQLGSKIIAVDTEFERSRTFYAIPGLIQLAIEGQVAFIDPVAVSIDTYDSLLCDKRSLKLLHACGEDLELLKRMCGEVPEPLFDTQVAATYAGLRPQIGYQGLVMEMLGIDIPKHQTRSDWLRRPLSADQLEYAALDVHYLEEMYEGLVERLKKVNRLEWVREDCQLLVQNAKKELLPEEYYRHVGNAWQLSPRQLAVLDELCQWRETEVRRIDIPRSFLFSDALLLDIAKLQPQSKTKLSSISGFKPGVVRKYAEVVLDKITDADKTPKDELPSLVQEPLSKSIPSVAKKLKAVIRVIAEKHKLPPEVFCRKKVLESLMLRYVESIGSGDDIQLPIEFDGWRSEFVLEPLMTALDENRKDLQRFAIK